MKDVFYVKPILLTSNKQDPKNRFDYVLENVAPGAGNVNYYKNIGSTQSPSWSLVTETVAGAEATSYLGLDGFSVPFVVKDNNGIWNLYLGNETGTINHYQFEPGTVGQGTLVDESFQDIREGDRSSVGWADFTGDGTWDLVMGQSGGGLSLYTGDDVVIEVDENDSQDWSVFPNPGNALLNVQTNASDRSVLSVFNALGQKIFEEIILGPVQVNTADWNRGCYVLRLQDERGTPTKRWIKN